MHTEEKLKRIDLELLPEEARKELLDFYEFLVEKYGIVKKERRSKAEIISKFAGILKLSVDPLEYQRSVREEWN
ncbi:DUF2281 domain-containing protein [Thermodesulfatator atlanticus]